MMCLNGYNIEETMVSKMPLNTRMIGDEGTLCNPMGRAGDGSGVGTKRAIHFGKQPAADSGYKAA
jgi:hypothetical protein